MRLDGKVAIITGAARGIGAACARLFAKEGACVIIGDVLENEGREVESEINRAGGTAVFTFLDVTKASHWQRIMALTVEKFGMLNILLNNAGIVDRSSVEDTTELAWDRIMNVNAKGAFLGIKSSIPHMWSKGGAIVNICSISAVSSLGYPAYNASKGAVRTFTRKIAVDCANSKIRINCIHPGTVWTYMSQYQTRKSKKERAIDIPMGRVGDPMEVAYAALFLASDEASFITGSELIVDGGVMARQVKY